MRVTAPGQGRFSPKRPAPRQDDSHCPPGGPWTLGGVLPTLWVSETCGLCVGTRTAVGGGSRLLGSRRWEGSLRVHSQTGTGTMPRAECGQGRPSTSLRPAHRSPAQPAVGERHSRPRRRARQRKTGVWSRPQRLRDTWGELTPLQSTRGHLLPQETHGPLPKFSVLPGWFRIVLRTDTGRGWLPPARGGLPASPRLPLTSAPRRKRPAGPWRLCLHPPASSCTSNPARWLPCPHGALRCPGTVASGKGGWFASEAEEEPALGVDSAVRGPGAGLANWGPGSAAPTGRPALPPRA